MIAGDLAERLVEQRVEVVGVHEQQEDEDRRRARSATTQLENLPWAVSTLTSRRMSMRARMFVVT